MSDAVAELKAEALLAISAAADAEALAQVEREYLGRKGRLSSLMRGIGKLPAGERPAFGQAVNTARQEVTARAAERREALLSGPVPSGEPPLDVTLPGRAPQVGRPHPLAVTFDRVAAVLTGLGFQEMHGPEVEEYQYNFAALNYPEEHPAMDEQMSFYLAEDLLLRTQTTALQGRVMPTLEPPFRVFTLGRCFRYEAVDATHSHTFHQVDGFMVDHVVSLADLKGTLAALARELFGEEVEVRFRPDFFPFVEPGVEIAVSSRGGWLELGGAGLIHPHVLRYVGLDPEAWSGFAFGLGLDRMPMHAHGIRDIRLLFENDLRLLRQF